MKVCLTFILSLALLSTACSKKEPDPGRSREANEQQLRRLSQQITEAEVADDLPSFIQTYSQQAISMPEYQLTLSGRAEIESYYREIFKRQNIKTYQRQVQEFIHLGKTIVEIGTFIKEYTRSENDSLITLSGQYWNVWAAADGNFKLKGEAFGYFHPVAHPETLIVTNHPQPDEADVPIKNEIPFELKAYNALMEKGVRNRDAMLRSGFFMEAGSFKPFADTTVTGMDQIKPFLKAYSSRGTVTINSIICYTYDFEYDGDYLLEYDMFKVAWSRPDVSGRTEGKGIRIWKRQADHSLRLYREIGTHNQLN